MGKASKADETIIFCQSGERILNETPSHSDKSQKLNNEGSVMPVRASKKHICSWPPKNLRATSHAKPAESPQFLSGNHQVSGSDFFLITKRWEASHNLLNQVRGAFVKSPLACMSPSNWTSVWARP